MSEHTPGPWTVRHDAETFAIIGPEPSWVTGVDRKTHNAAPNARLIAAAPDLLAALECLMPTDFDKQPDDYAAEWHRARAAIAKARGAQ